jgi:predicted site-specific integrase-resolvase
MMPIAVAAKRLGVSQSLVHVWVRHGVLQHDQRQSVSRVWVRLNADDLVRLDGSSPAAPSLPDFVEVQRTDRLSREAL